MSNIKLLAAIALSLAATAPAFAQREINPAVTGPAITAPAAMPAPAMHVAMDGGRADTEMTRHASAAEYAPDLYVGM